MKLNHKILKFFGIFTICYFLFTIPLASAQTPTPEVTDQPGAADAIKGIRDAVKEKVQEQLGNLKIGAKRAYVGQITQISDSTLSLETGNGIIQVNIDKNTKFIGLNRNPIKQINVKTNDYVIAMGLLESDDSITGKRIVVIEKPSIPTKEVAVGKITDITKDGKTITLKNDNKTKTYSLSVNKNAVITEKIAGKVTKMDITDLQKGDVIVAVGVPDKTNSKILNVSLVHLLSKSLGIPTQKATSPTPTTKPKATPTP